MKITTMEEFITDSYVLTFPENWIYWQDEEDEETYSFCIDSDDAMGVLQISWLTSEEVSFDIVDQQEDIPESQEIHIGDYEALFFEEIEEEEKAYNWITGQGGTLIYFTYITDTESAHEEELTEVMSILDTLEIKG